MTGFFAFHPRRWRIALAVGSGVGALLALRSAWAVVAVGDVWAGVAGLLALALSVAMVVLVVKLRPRPDWGVRVSPVTLSVSRPPEAPLDIPWMQIRTTRRLGRRRHILELWVGSEGRVRLHQALFGSRRDFEALARAIEEHIPPAQWDA